MPSETPTLTVPPKVAALKLEFEAGGHSPDGKACIMEVVAMMAGEPWSDHPACTSPVIGAFCRTFWDKTPKTWQGLLDRVERIAGSASTTEVDRARGYLAADWAVRRFAPRWLRRTRLDDDAAAEAAEAAEAAWAAEAAGLKGKSYSEKKAWFMVKIKEALHDEVEASLADGFALLDAMLELGSVAEAQSPAGVERAAERASA